MLQISEEMKEYYTNRCVDKCNRCTYSTCSREFPNTICEKRTNLEECEDCYEDGFRIFDEYTEGLISLEINESETEFQEMFFLIFTKKTN